jgi:hypothetical protein
MAGRWYAILPAAQREAATFIAAVGQPRATQLAMLERILAENSASEFGRQHGFASIKNIAEFRRRVPVASYEAFRPAIDRMANGMAKVLTGQPVIAFEETGGTASGRKLIPYTAAGLDGFRGAVLPWLASLAQRRPSVTAGSAYVTISPATRAPRQTAGGIPIGLASDAAYLGDEVAPAFASLLAVSPQVGGITDVACWQVASLTALVAAEDLSFISLWSPTFLTALLASLPGHAEAVLAGLDGPARARLERAMATPALDTQLLWPRLDCISCWNDGPAAGFAAQLAEDFPRAVIEPKGLLATEAAITLPFAAAGQCIPAITSCFIEFLDSAGEPRLCDELVTGEDYRLAITTESGLYRYDIGDIVHCSGHDALMPLLRFVGRHGRSSDIVGEKLTEAFAAETISALGIAGAIAASADPPGYVLLLDDQRDDVQALGQQGDQLLCRNPQYDYARRIGQLAALRVIVRPGFAAEAMRRGIASGRRMGDVKPLSLIPLSTLGE